MTVSLKLKPYASYMILGFMSGERWRLAAGCEDCGPVNSGTGRTRDSVKGLKKQPCVYHQVWSFWIRTHRGDLGLQSHPKDFCIACTELALGKKTAQSTASVTQRSPVHVLTTLARAWLSWVINFTPVKGRYIYNHSKHYYKQNMYYGQKHQTQFWNSKGGQRNNCYLVDFFFLLGNISTSACTSWIVTSF